MYFRQKNKENTKAQKIKMWFKSDRLPAVESEHEKYPFSIRTYMWLRKVPWSVCLGISSVSSYRGRRLFIKAHLAWPYFTSQIFHLWTTVFPAFLEEDPVHMHNFLHIATKKSGSEDSSLWLPLVLKIMHY